MSSFKRRVPAGTDPHAQGPPLGTRIAAQSGQLVVSSGVSSFDDVVGGGFPLGSVVLVKQDRGTFYANLLLRYFTAQGCVDKHGFVAVVCDADSAQFLRTLPRPIDGSRVDVAEDADDDGEAEADALPGDNVASNAELKIAWRYKPVAAFSTAVKADGSGASRSSKQGRLSYPGLSQLGV
jgi:elongator complex protein 4